MTRRNRNLKKGKQEEPDFFSPVQPERVSRLIETQIKEAIIKHHYRAGDKLPAESELAKIFGASRSAVREAIRSLELSGFVEVKKGVQGGAFVIQKGDSSLIAGHIRDVLRLRKVGLEDILQTRLSIEPEVAAQAALRATPEEIEHLREITKDQLDGFDSNNPVMQFDRNPRFHRVIAEISGNQVFIIVMEILMEIHAFRMNQFKINFNSMKKITGQHEKIIEAFEKKDADLAREIMRKHVLAVHSLHVQHEENGSAV